MNLNQFDSYYRHKWLSALPDIGVGKATKDQSNLFFCSDFCWYPYRYCVRVLHHRNDWCWRSAMGYYSLVGRPSILAWA
ncbi:hypothetical protein OK016_15895 [Vibrio chagasii]|nr:hypothetical protein [Vibrio chagasii]